MDSLFQFFSKPDDNEENEYNEYNQYAEDEEDNDIRDETYPVINEKALMFRSILSKWKEEQLEKMTDNTQDNIVLNSYIKISAKMYDRLKNILEGNLMNINIEDNNDIEKRLLEILLISNNNADIDSALRLEILNIISRDLLEFPFTYDTALINSLHKKSNIYLEDEY